MSETFNLNITWNSNNKPFTYAEYSREYLISASGKNQPIPGTAATSYKGTAENYNPEELLIGALSGCHMLSYLAVCATSGIEILSYIDEPFGSLEKHGSSMKFREITLKPKIKLKKQEDLEKAKTLHDKAHHICFISNSLNFPVQVEPEFTF